MERRKFSREFKLEAVKLVRDRGVTAAQHSVLAGLGLGLIVIPDRDDAPTTLTMPGGGTITATRELVGEHSVVDALEFTEVDEDDEIPASAYPATITEIRASGLRQRMVRFPVPRSILKDRHIETIAAELGIALTAGLGRVVDAAALAALTGGDNPVDTGTWANAIAAGATFDQIAAYIGTAALAVPAAADQGALFHAGLKAVASDASANSFVGCWADHAVALSHELGLLVRKTSQSGDLEVTAFFGLVGLSPTGATRLWKLAAGA